MELRPAAVVTSESVRAGKAHSMRRYNATCSCADRFCGQPTALCHWAPCGSQECKVSSMNGSDGGTRVMSQ